MSEIEIYRSDDKKIEIQVQFDGETVWLNQQQMAELFQQTKQNISLHINNCYKEKELLKKATVKDSLTVQKEGKRLVPGKWNITIWTLLFLSGIVSNPGEAYSSANGQPNG